MPLTTSHVSITPQTGWQLVATNPSYIQIRNRTSRPWQLGVTAAGAPTNENAVLTFAPQQQEDGHVFVKATASVGVFYIRVLEDGPVGEQTQFGLLIDA
jgi:hypothetical protein